MIGRVLNWGIAGAEKIAHDFAVALSRSRNHKIMSIASKDIDKGLSLARKFNIPLVYGNYGLLGRDDNVDVAYVAVPTPQHVDVTKTLLANNKHILCEAPLAMNFFETTELINFATSKKLFLMEGIWSRLLPAYQALFNKIENDIIGDVRHINLCFGQQLDSGTQAQSCKELSSNTALDLNIFGVQLCQRIFKDLKPLKISCEICNNKNNVDISITSNLLYEEGKSANFCYDSKMFLCSNATIIGSDGIIRIPCFWSPTKFYVNKETYEYDVPKCKYTTIYENTTGLIFEAEEVRKCLKKNLRESSIIPYNDSLELSSLVDTIRKKIGIQYKQDCFLIATNK